MTKILILDGDNIEMTHHVDASKNKFLFLITKHAGKKIVYHLDTTEGKLWLAQEDLKSLGKRHQEIVKEYLK